MTGCTPDQPRNNMLFGNRPAVCSAREESAVARGVSVAMVGAGFDRVRSRDGAVEQ